MKGQHSCDPSNGLARVVVQGGGVGGDKWWMRAGFWTCSDTEADRIH